MHLMPKSLLSESVAECKCFSGILFDFGTTHKLIFLYNAFIIVDLSLETNKYYP